MFKTSVKLSNGSVTEIRPEIEETGSIRYAVIKRNALDFTKVKYVDISVNETKIKAGDDGFFLCPGGWWRAELHDCAIGYFTEHSDIEYINYDPHLYVLGINHNDNAYIAIASGMREASHHRIAVDNNEYEFYFRFEIDEEELYEDIKIEIHKLEGDLSYSAMGREYRKYVLENGFVSIKDRLNENLKYAAESVCVRVRLGWKPVPCTILEQTEENEPPVHVACTFKQVEDLMREYKKAGIEKAEFCLVGWNKGGHDGRWPQILPPEETIGGKEDLLSLIKTAKELGYTISPHTNSTDAYTLAENFDWDIVARKKDGSPSVEAEKWGGGRTYNVCPAKSLELAYETFPPVAELGFYGAHYIDVVTATPPRYCYNPSHKVNRKEACNYFDKIFEYSRELFGTVGCEVGMEHSMKKCDFILYSTMDNGLDRKVEKTDLFSEYVPFWHIVFHGIVLSNPYAGTVNAALNRNQDAMLRLIELGGRPVIYYYSKFVSDGTDWMGDMDFRTDTSEDVKSGTEAALKTVNIYNEMNYLQYEFMDKHEKIGDNCYRTVYSDGSEVTVDYNNKTYSLRKGKH
ncbi:MAG: DUF5696 domain-containing protein [Monoglobaceae bacterium]